MSKKLKVIISGGGTGGHIFPAISIADAIKKREPDAEILFVGAIGRMEMERVPQAGYKIEGLKISGFNRKNPFSNIPVLLRLLKSLYTAKKIIKRFNPDIVVGVGGYASGPTLWSAAQQGIPTLIQEQNSYAGVTNRILSHKAASICVAYDKMDKFFPKEKLTITGNPVRPGLNNTPLTREEALELFGLEKDKKTILVVGGSLGARTINDSIAESLDNVPKNIQLIWQSGKFYDKTAKEAAYGRSNVVQYPFISRMDAAYKAADLVISRAGASSISELCLLGKPVILVPSPNVAEDHQTKNALALSSKNAAVLISDKDAKSILVKKALSLVQDDTALKKMGENIFALAQKNSAARIADIIFQLVEKQH